MRSVVGSVVGSVEVAGARGQRGFWRGALEAVWVPLLFTLGGLGWLAAERAALAQAGPAVGAYAHGVAPVPDTWLVDGFNVVQVALLGGRDRDAWWTRRPARGAARPGRGASRRSEAPVSMVFDGARGPAESPSGSGCRASSRRPPTTGSSRASRRARSGAGRGRDRGPQARGARAPSRRARRRRPGSSCAAVGERGA